jgi:hypothetical protein
LDGGAGRAGGGVETSIAVFLVGVLTLFIVTPPNGGFVWVRMVDEVSGAVFEPEITLVPA